MRSNSKEKIKDMKVSGFDGEVVLDLVGSRLSTDEINDALRRSTLLNEDIK